MSPAFRSNAKIRASDCLNVRRLLALRTRRDFERDLLAFLQRLEPRHVDCREMCEKIFAAAVRGDEAKALRVVKPLNCTCCHVYQSSNQKIIGSNPADVSISRAGKYGVSATAKQPDRSCFS